MLDYESVAILYRRAALLNSRPAIPAPPIVGLSAMIASPAGKFFPRTVQAGPCKEVILRDKFSLLDFPILQCWPLDGGRFITLPSVITKDPKTGKRNSGTYRLQVYDERTTGMHWQR